MAETPAIEISDLWFSYNAMPVLRDVNLRIRAGSHACIVGPNGGGKSTLLKLILGLLKPDRGTIRLFGETPEKGRRKTGYTPQYGLFDPKFPATVFDVVLTGRIGHGGSRGSDRAAAGEALREVGLADLSKRSFAALSGGQRQRVLIARALASEPEMLLLDEPTAGLDIAAEEEFHDLLAHLGRKLTLLIVSHDVGFVSDLVDTVVCVNRETVMVHPTAELTGELFSELYGRDVRLIRHDHNCLTDCERRHGE
jgi:zinc transport system ATP-binding protein